MGNVTRYARTIILALLFGAVFLLLGGGILTLIDGERYAESFFGYRIRLLDDFPFWFASLLVMFIIKGFYLWHLARVEGNFQTPHGGPWGSYGFFLPLNPLKLVAVDLITTPLVLFAFVLVRAFSI